MGQVIKIFCMIYVVALAVVSVALYMIASNGLCKMGYDVGVVCKNPNITDIVKGLYIWTLYITYVPMALYKELSESLQNINVPGVLPNMGVVAFVWLPLVTGVFFWIKAVAAKVF